MKKTNNQKPITTNPLVSVIMPAYNATRYMREAIDSILSQTYQNFELIIVDDASKDDTKKVIKDYIKRYPKKVKGVFLTINQNGGGDACANEGVKIAQGEYLARMDADDIADSHRLEKQVAFLQSHKDVVLLGSNAYVIDEHGVITGEKTEPSTHKEIYKLYGTLHPMIHPTCMIRRMIDGKPFAYQTIYKDNRDYYTFFRLLCDGYKFANLPENLLYYRIHGNNYTFANAKYKFYNTLHIRFEMVRLHGYKPSFSAVISNITQTIIISLLPENVLTGVYMLLKGILTPSQLLIRLLPIKSLAKAY